MPESELRWLDEGVARGIITADQREALRALREPAGPRREAGAALSGVTVAYVLGALLVCFAAGWFLVSRWASLGPWGVLAVTGTYGAVLWGGGRTLEGRGFPRAGQLCLMLAITLVPVAAWALLRLAGEWPDDGPDPLRFYTPFAATRAMVLELTTVLAALLVWRRRRFPLLTVPIAIALWWLWFHLGQLVGFDREREWFDQWLMLAAGLALLAGADAMDRWQRRVAPAEGDFAAPLWITATVAFAFAFFASWLDLDEGKHVLAPVALAMIALALRTRRVILLMAGVAGVFGYLAWLAGDVFEDSALFPVALAGLGIALIFTTVWLQRRFPALAGRVGGETGRDLPWPQGLSWLPALIAAGFAAAVLQQGPADRAQQRFMEQFQEQRRASRAPRPALPVAPDSTAVRKP